MNYNQAQNNMIKQQIRTWNVLDPRVIDALHTINRKEFVPNQYRKTAFVDAPLPLPHGQFMLPPKEAARILQALDLQATDKILEVGTGSGYLTALLASMGHEVISLEWYRDILTAAKKNLQSTKLDNIILEEGDGSHGWAEDAPYDVICITGSVYQLSNRFIEQLKVGGRLAAIIGNGPSMQVTLIKKLDDSAIQKTILFETQVLPLINAEKPEEFQF